MKNLIISPYLFTPGGSGVGTIQTNIINFDVRYLLAIINITRETIIYSSALSGKGYTSLSGSTITLEFDTSTHNAADFIQIIYNSTTDYPSIVESPRTDDLIALLQRLTKICESLLTVDSAQRQRISLDSAPAQVQILGTASQGGTWNLNNVTTISSMNQEQYINIAKYTYAASIRSRLTIQ